jgi:hypothetical protein
MGVLLAFMFVWNMVGALILLPALAYFLLPQGKPAADVTAAPQPVAARKPLNNTKAAQRPTVLEVSHEG